MTETEERRFVLLLRALTSLENEGEILQAVRSLQAIAKRNRLDVMTVGITSQKGGKIDMDDPRQHVAVKLRGLGFTLSAARNRNPEMQAAMDRLCAALKSRGSIDVVDLLATLASMEELIRALADAAARQDIFDATWWRRPG